MDQQDSQQSRNGFVIAVIAALAVLVIAVALAITLRTPAEIDSSAVTPERDLQSVSPIEERSVSGREEEEKPEESRVQDSLPDVSYEERIFIERTDLSELRKRYPNLTPPLDDEIASFLLDGMENPEGATFMSEELGITFTFPHSDEQGAPHFRLAPYDQEPGVVYFGPVLNGVPGGYTWNAKYKMELQPAQDVPEVLQQLAEEAEASEYGYRIDVHHHETGYPIVAYQGNGLCNDGEWIVVGQKYNYQFSTLCGAPTYPRDELLLSSIRLIGTHGEEIVEQDRYGDDTFAYIEKTDTHFIASLLQDGEETVISQVEHSPEDEVQGKALLSIQFSPNGRFVYMEERHWEGADMLVYDVQEERLQTFPSPAIINGVLQVAFADAEEGARMAVCEQAYGSAHMQGLVFDLETGGVLFDTASYIPEAKSPTSTLSVQCVVYQDEFVFLVQEDAGSPALQKIRYNVQTEAVTQDTL